MLVPVLAATAAFVALPALAVHPLVYASLGREDGPGGVRPRGGIWPLSLTTGVSAWLLLFSLLAREVPGYLLTLPLSFALLCALAAVGTIVQTRRQGNTRGIASPLREAFTPSREGIAILVATLAFFAGLLLLRVNYSQVFFDPNRYGAEKLFNIQFIQSFLFADSWPPESPWYAGSPSGYYVLSKAIPGLVGHLLHHVFGVRGATGVIFHVSDALSAATAFAVIASVLVGVFRRGVPDAVSTMQPSPLSSLRPIALALPFAFLPWLGAPARALSQAFQNKIDLWSLSRIVDNTINEYPFWNYLWADNHSHSSALLIQFGFFGWFLAFLRAKDRLVPAIVAGVMASTLAMSHSGSVFVDLAVCGAFVGVALWHAASRKELGPLVRDFGIMGATALVLTLPDLATRGQPNVRWYFVPAQYTTGFLDFLNIYFTHVLLFLACIILALVSTRRRGCPLARAQVTEIVVSILGAVVLSVLGRAAWGLAFLLFNVMRVVSFHAERSLANETASDVGSHQAGSEHDASHAMDSVLRRGACLALFALLLTPEVVASNWDMGEKFMRYNTVFRFLFESYAFVPLLLALALAGPLMTAFSKRVTVVVSVALACLAAGVFAFVQTKTARKRIEAVSAAGGEAGLDALAWLGKERPGDAAIIRWLVDDPRGNIRIVEECGMSPKPTSYTILGRLSGVSGRPALCGWSHHMFLFQKTLRNPEYDKKSTWENLQERDKWITAVYSLADLDPSARKGFRDFGITHVAFGEAEREQYPGLTLDALAKYGRVVLREGDFGVVELALAP